MPRSRHAGRLGGTVIGALAAVVLLTGGTALAQSPNDLTIVSPESPASLDFEAAADGRPSATLVLGISNATSDPITVEIRLFDTTTGTATSVGDTAPDKPSLVLESGDPAIPAHSVAFLNLRLVLPTGAKAESFEGVLTASGDTAGPAEIVLVGKQAPPVAKGARVEPASVTMTVTRLVPSIVPWSCDCWLDFLWWSSGYEVTYSGMGTSGTLPAEPDVELSSDTGGRLVARQFGPPAGSAEGRAEIRVGAADRAGTYSGTLALDPEVDESPAVELTIKVQDLFIWPILALLSGAVVAWWFGPRRDRTRAKEVLTLELATIRDRYVDARRHVAKRHERWLPDAFTMPPSDTEKPEFDPNGGSRGDKLKLRIDEAADQETLTDLANEVEELRSLVDTWIEAGAAADALNVRVQLHRPLDQGAKVFARSDELLERGTPLTTPADGEALKKQLADCSGAIETLVVAHQPYSRARAGWEALSDADRRDLEESDPEAYWSTVVRAAETPDALSQVVDELRARELRIAERLRQPGATATGAEPFSRPAAPVAPLIAIVVSQADRRSPADIKAAIRRHDVFSFWAIFVITTFVFFLTQYVDKSFGGTWQYLAVFLAGASAELVIDWQLLPWYRSYRSTAA